jgi:tRNA pseudouridine13 synthase
MKQTINSLPKRIYPQLKTTQTNTLSFNFRQSKDDFKVDEIASYSSAKKGGFIVLHIRKVNLSTIDMLKILQDELKYYNIGYAGLKDKYATTTQYISLPIKYAYITKKLKHPQIEIIDVYYSKDAIKMGDLDSNRFSINLQEVSHKTAKRLNEVFEQIQRYGMPNYFGYQRFGRESSNAERAKEVAYGNVILKDKKMQRLLGNTYQSILFNSWLAKRVEMNMECIDDETSTQVFNVMNGDILVDAQTKRFVNVTDIATVKKSLKDRKLLITGLLAGQKVWRAKDEAGALESEFDDMEIIANGTRREAWIYPSKMSSTYNKNTQVYSLEFILPKGAYATVLLENMANKELG